MSGATLCRAQWPERVAADTSQTGEVTFKYDVGAGFGLSRIENEEGERERFAVASLMPEFSYGKFGVGLLINLPFHIGLGGLRDEDFDQATDYLSWIRYVQYAEKRDLGFYGRFGGLDEAILGYGQHVNLYRNTISLDEPRRGIEADYDAGTFLVESVYSNVIGAEVMGVRGAYRPFRLEPASPYQHLTLGASLAGDLSSNGALVNPDRPGVPFFVPGTLPDVADSLGFSLGADDGKLFMVGVDAGMPVLGEPGRQLLAYTGLSKILGHGSGWSVGVQGLRSYSRRTRVEGRIEQRLLGKEYLPSYFDALYEAQRFQEVGITLEDGREFSAVNTKRNILMAQQKVRLGSHVSVRWRYQGILRVQGSYEHLWNQKRSGWFHADARIRAAGLPFYFRFIFDRLNVGSAADIFHGSRRDALVRLEFAYQFWKYAMVGFGFRQSFEAVERNGVVVGREKRNRIDPRVMLVLTGQ
jgi:hypothetical protein